jgi:hypothetical protein
MHGLVAIFLEVIALAIILILIGLFVLVVLVFAMRVIAVSIISLTIVMSSVIMIALVALMVVAILAMMLLVAQVTAVCDGKISRPLLSWLFLLLDLLKNAGCFIGSLTLLEKGNKPTQVRGTIYLSPQTCTDVL